MDLKKTYYAKLMLAGEYGVVAGSEAITVPLKLFSARLDVQDHPSAEEKQKIATSVSGLRKLYIYLESLPRNSFYARPDFKALGQLIKTGHYIKSTIPAGYGVGSSGAVTALVYDQFFHEKEGLDTSKIRKDLATIESCFHGKSSGVDAMACYTGKPLHFLPDQTIVELPEHKVNPGKEYRLFLLDTGEVFDTGPLVQYFLDRLKDKAYEEIIRNDYFVLIHKLVQILTGKADADAGVVFRAISDFQYHHFRRMIPDSMVDFWLDGQVSNTYYLKLNGSGGGFLLGIAHKDSKEVVEEMLGRERVMWVM